MAIVMKQLGRADEGIEAIKSFRHRCSLQAQESLDNVLLDLYKKCGRVDEQIVLLKEKLRLIQHGIAFNGNPTKTARSHGKKFQLSIKEETSRILSNLGWAYMQQHNYVAAEVAYRKALYFVEDANKACNLGVCLMRQGKAKEATIVLENIISLHGEDIKSLERAKQLLKEIQNFQKHEGGSKRSLSTLFNHNNNEKDSTSVSDGEKHYSNNKHGLLSSSTDFVEFLSGDNALNMIDWEAKINIEMNLSRKKHRRLPVFEEIVPISDFSPSTTKDT
ncbi:protein SULFUR DEFICIENCY-INDUCED 1 isoform X2 [Cryptomeria japonica]|nr:protein SULFUR DEFICIENCY-INDUCED 1 isoform X2 [Cryptomeria japonica]